MIREPSTLQGPTPSGQPTPSRRRPTDAIREASRLTEALALGLGRTIRERRRRLKLTQARLASRVGVQQSWISRIELGRGGAVPLELWVRIGVALGRPFAASFTRPLGEERRPVDTGHLEIQEHLLALARVTGRLGLFELPTRPFDPAYSIDVCVRDGHARVLFIEEAWNTFGDVGAALRSTRRKEAEAADLAATIDDGSPYRVATVWVVRASATNRATLGRYPEIVRSVFLGSSRAWTRALNSAAEPPTQPGLVWYDPATRRVHEWRGT